MNITKTYQAIKKAAEDQLHYQLLSPEEARHNNDFVMKQISAAQIDYQSRLKEEFFGYGPLKVLLDDPKITEILINDPSSIWYETNGQLQKHDDCFFCHVSYKNIIERLSQKTGQHLSLNHPFIEGHWNKSRISIVDGSVTRHQTIVSIRKHPENPWTLKKLHEQNWCDSKNLMILESLLNSKANLLIVGETGSGKTSIANAFLQQLKKNERALVIEDSSELQIPNSASLKLLTREDAFGQLKTIDQQELLKRALRLRPDRLIMGEIRNTEAKDFLMLLATGHKGCFATLHASHAQEALIRLEMLIQLGAPQWSLQAIRRLIFLSLHYIVVTDRNSQGLRRLKGIYKLSSLEDSGLTLDSVDSLAREATSSDFGA